MGDECVRCGSAHQIHLHHIQPRATGGSDADENLVPLCQVCHDKIHTGVTRENPAQFTGKEFWDWVEEYDGEEKEPWETEFVCNNCGHEWQGKPLLQRTSTNIACPNNRCPIGRGYVRIGDLMLDAMGSKKLIEEDDSMNYTGIGFELTERDRTIIDGIKHRSNSRFGSRPVSSITAKRAGSKCE